MSDANTRLVLSIAQQLYADVLVSVLSFLPLHDAAAAATTCRQWLSHAAKEPSRGLSLHAGPRSSFLATLCSAPLLPTFGSVSSSVLHWHVTAARINEVTADYFLFSNQQHALALRPNVPVLLQSLGRFKQLQQLSLRLPGLRPATVDGAVQLPLAHDLAPLLQLQKLHTLALSRVHFWTPQLLPPLLRFLSLGAESHMLLHEQHLADAIGQLPQLEHLNLMHHRQYTPQNAGGPELNFPRWESWQQLSHLHTVHLYWTTLLRLKATTRSLRTRIATAPC